MNRVTVRWNGREVRSPLGRGVLVFLMCVIGAPVAALAGVVLAALLVTFSLPLALGVILAGRPS